MAFPITPVNGQVAIVNNISYTYDLANESWYRNGQTSANIIVTDTANVVANTSSTSTTTGALKVAGGVGIVGNVYAGNFFYANGSAVSGAGAVGYTGSAGAGYTGSQGTAGYTGSAGAAGNTGTTGYTGSASAGYTGSAGTVGYTGSSGAGAAGGYINLSMVGAISPPFTGTARFYSPTDVTINTVYANLSAAPTSGNLNFVIKKNGVSIGTTFVLSSALMTPVSVNISLVTTDYLTMDVTGSAASDLYVRLKYV